MAKNSPYRKLSFGVAAVVIITVVFAMFGLQIYWEAPPRSVIAATMSGDKGLVVEVNDEVPMNAPDAENDEVSGEKAEETVAPTTDKRPPVAEIEGFDRDATDTSKAGVSEFVVQSVLSAAQSAVISGQMDGVITQIPFKSGDVFAAGDVLVRYECSYENARISEIKSRLRVAERRLEALSRLRENKTASDVEYLAAVEDKKQTTALLKQANAIAERCIIYAPFDGRVLERKASAFEASKSGRALMRIGSLEPLEAELLIPSLWLRWINVGTPVSIYVNESDAVYSASIVRIHGEVDPVSRTAHVVAKIDEYQEELLPGMSGNATFDKLDLDISFGFLGMNFDRDSR